MRNWRFCSICCESTSLRVSRIIEVYFKHFDVSRLNFRFDFRMLVTRNGEIGRFNGEILWLFFYYSEKKWWFECAHGKWISMEISDRIYYNCYVIYELWIGFSVRGKKLLIDVECIALYIIFNELIHFPRDHWELCSC